MYVYVINLLSIQQGSKCFCVLWQNFNSRAEITKEHVITTCSSVLSAHQLQHCLSITSHSLTFALTHTHTITHGKKLAKSECGTCFNCEFSSHDQRCEDSRLKWAPKQVFATRNCASATLCLSCTVLLSYEIFLKLCRSCLLNRYRNKEIFVSEYTNFKIKHSILLRF